MNIEQYNKLLEIIDAKLDARDSTSDSAQISDSIRLFELDKEMRALIEIATDRQNLMNIF